MRGRDGAVRFGLHSFYYPAVAAPFYAALGHRGFYVLNALCVWGTAVLIFTHHARRDSPGRALGFTALAVLFSAAWGYVFFMQTEALYALLVALTYHQWLAGRPGRAALAGGLAAGAQLPLGALLLPLLGELAAKRRFRALALCVAVAATAMAPQVVYNLGWLGEAFPMRAVGLADPSNVSAFAVAASLFDPSMGVLWFYPFLPFALMAAPRDARTAAVIGSALLVALAMNTVRNLYSHQIGVRFGNYLFVPFAFLPASLAATGVLRKLAIGFAVAAGAGLALDPLGSSRDMDLSRRALLPYRVASSLAVYLDNPEVFVHSAKDLGGGRVLGRRVFHDGWTEGGERARLMVRDVAPGDLELELGAWARAGQRQRVTIAGPSGRSTVFRLEPLGTDVVRVPLTDADVLRYGRWGDATYTYLDVWAEGWVPAWAGASPTHDRRRLGVRVVRVEAGGRRLFSRE